MLLLRSVSLQWGHWKPRALPWAMLYCTLGATLYHWQTNPKNREWLQMIKIMYSHHLLIRLLISFVLSAFVVGALVGNAYIVCNIGCPAFFEPIGQFLVDVGFVVAIPPGFVLWVLANLGFEWQLRGRESFIESNLWLWIYCVFFYTIAIYLILSLWHRYRLRRKTISNKA